MLRNERNVCQVQRELVAAIMKNWEDRELREYLISFCSWFEKIRIAYYYFHKNDLEVKTQSLFQKEVESA